MADEETYAFANARAVQRERLRTLEALLDPGTVRQLEARGVTSGWRCLEVGAGGGSIAAWLCARVGPKGRVVATDLDVTVLGELSHPNLDVVVHDVVADDIPQAEFDLVHLRLLLGWLAEPLLAIRRLEKALKPGGWLVAEEMDFVSVVPDPRMEPRAGAVFARVVEAHNELLAAQHRFDPAYGRRVAGDLADAGLVELGCEGRASMWRGGSPGGLVWKHTFTQLREPLAASGRVTAAEVEEAIALCDDPGLSFMSQVVMAAWGRRPAS